MSGRDPGIGHYCADATCWRTVASYVLFCSTHWALVPKEARQAVNRTATIMMRRKERGTVEERRQRVEAFMLARKHALAAYETAVGPVDTSGVLRKHEASA